MKHFLFFYISKPIFRHSCPYMWKISVKSFYHFFLLLAAQFSKIVPIRQNKFDQILFCWIHWIDYKKCFQMCFPFFLMSMYVYLFKALSSYREPKLNTPYITFLDKLRKLYVSWLQGWLGRSGYWVHYNVMSRTDCHFLTSPVDAT